MCGRYAIELSGEEISEPFGLSDAFLFEPRYNIAPGQEIPAIQARADGEDGHRSSAMLHWGLIPFWADDPESAHEPINARSETVDEKPTFRAAFKERRCLIPATGFYEWVSRNGSKQPYLIRMTDGDPFAFAGLWERWEGEDRCVESCTILTTRPNQLIKPFHDRMPVILPPARYGPWLNPDTPPDKRKSFLTPHPSDRMEAYPVSKHVNNPRNDDPSCVSPVPDEDRS